MVQVEARWMKKMSVYYYVSRSWIDENILFWK